MVIEDFFNPRRMPKFYISKNHFIERHKDKLVRKIENKRKVLNTIKNQYELAWTNCEVKKGGFHTHTLLGDIDDDIILNPSIRIQRASEKIWGLNQYPSSLLQDEWGLGLIKTELINYAIRERCEFVGNSNASIDITPEQEYGTFDDYWGWRGMVSYVTKNMYNVDMIDEIYDTENNDLIHR